MEDIVEIGEANEVSVIHTSFFCSKRWLEHISLYEVAKYTERAYLAGGDYLVADTVQSIVGLDYGIATSLVEWNCKFWV